MASAKSVSGRIRKAERVERRKESLMPRMQKEILSETEEEEE